MKIIDKLEKGFRGLIDAFARFPLTGLFLFAATIVNAISINAEEFDYEKILVALIFGGFLSVVVEMAFERFYDKKKVRLGLMAGSAIVTLGYYLIIRSAPELSMEIIIKTMVSLFGLFIAFIWIPSIKGKVTFNESFMSGFKAFFITIFFSVIIFAGISLIYAAIDELLFDINNKVFPHTANIVFVMFAPMYFLSITPIYPGYKDESEEYDFAEIKKSASCPKYLEILLSYIIIPISTVFTMILLIYIGLNIGGSFWTNTLLEPMLVTYTIVVILLYILVSNLENKIVMLFRKIFPKVLVPLVLFQTINSVLKIRELGLTHGRYYVIMFGVFAIISGLIFSLLPIKKNGNVAVVLIALITISVIPPVDAFTISRITQVNLLEEVLIKNNMLENNKVKPSNEISEEDEEIIIRTVDYLVRMKYEDHIDWLPPDFNLYNDFKDTFGFNRYELSRGPSDALFFRSEKDMAIDVSGYDYFVNAGIYNAEYDESGKEIIPFEKNGMNFFLEKILSDDKFIISVKDESEEVLITFDGKEMFDRFSNYEVRGDEISIDDATFKSINDKAEIMLVVQSGDIFNRYDDMSYRFEVYVFVKIK